jgi:hypothetical protein
MPTPAVFATSATFVPASPDEATTARAAAITPARVRASRARTLGVRRYTIEPASDRWLLAWPDGKN